MYHDVTVIGGGITGLATAWWLNQKGIDVVLLERDHEVGGTMKTIRDNGWLIETGPNSALETTPLIRQLCKEIGIAGEIVYANENANNRYILRNHTLHALPMSPGAFFKSKLWSLPAKLRLLKEPFIGRAEHEETIAEFVERRLGKEFLDYAINPFVAGVYAGNPSQLSVQAAFPKLYALEKNYGSLIKGQIKGARERKKRNETSKDRAKLFAFKNGMQTLPNAIFNKLSDKIYTGATISSIQSFETSYKIHCTIEGKSTTIETNSVVLGVPSYVAATFLSSFDSEMTNQLNDVYYPPVAEVFLGFKTEDVKRPLDGFGFLIPQKENRKILGAIWSSSLFENRAPENHVAFTCFIGGSRQPELASLKEEQLIKIATDEVKELLPVAGAPVYTRVNCWEKAIPQYRLGHLDSIAKIEKFEKQFPGFYLTGNYRGGIAVGDCIKNAFENADRIVKLQRTASLKDLVV
ncbi:protoporphyrinogen oxidase [bacterium]|nr:protoporphyrinogen oxidase [bacterium]